MCPAIEREIFDAHVQHELEARLDFSEYSLCNGSLLVRNLETLEIRSRLCDGHIGHIDDGLLAHENVKSLLSQSRSLAGLARIVAEDMLGTQSVTCRTRSVWRVEGEQSRFDLRIRVPVVWAHELDRHELLLLTLSARALDLQEPARLVNRLLHRLRKSFSDCLDVVLELAYVEFVDENVDVMLLVLLEIDALAKFLHDAVHLCVLVSLAEIVVEHLIVLALSPHDDRSEDANLCLVDGNAHDLGAVILRLYLGHAVDDGIQDLLVRESLDLAIADEAVRMTDAREQYAEIIVDLGLCRHGRSRVVRV